MAEEEVKQVIGGQVVDVPVTNPDVDKPQVLKVITAESGGVPVLIKGEEDRGVYLPDLEKVYAEQRRAVAERRAPDYTGIPESAVRAAIKRPAHFPVFAGQVSYDEAHRMEERAKENE